MIRLFLLIMFVLVCPTPGHAQSSEFTIKVFGSEDVVPPTTPVITSINPVTTSQIDIEWSTSTDNFVVFGYVVLRDGEAVATTTLTSFSDVALTASTTYVYEVIAFDTVPNYSSSSIPATSTTLTIPVTPESEIKTSTIARVVLDSLNVDIGSATSSVNLKVRQRARIELRYGTTQSYESGYIVGSVYRRDHRIPIGNLVPETTYYYQVIGYTPSGIQTVLSSGSFTTLSDAPPPPPVNVTDFFASTVDNDVELTWSIPDEVPRDAVVRIVRSHLGFPVSINDGLVVYEGARTSYTDVASFRVHSTQYYTAFVIDPNGLVSSGAVTLAQAAQSQALPGDLGNSAVGNGGERVDEDQVLNEIPVDPNMPRAQDIYVRQNKQEFTLASSSFTLDSNEIFTVSIPANKIIGAFKTIVVTLPSPVDPDKQFSFLLRLNSQMTEYTASIAPMKQQGESQLVVDIYDYDAKVVGTYGSTISFVSQEQTSSSTMEVLWWRLQGVMWTLVLLAPFLTLALLWFIFWRRKTEE